MTNRIKAHRRKRGISQSTLAYITSLGQSTISEIENNKYIPRVDTAIRIAQALNTTVERLFIIE
jgi:DNA-binding XRE family transcriptional regulator